MRKSLRSVLVALALFGLSFEAHAQAYVTTAGQLAGAVAGYSADLPAAVAIGRGYRATPLAVSVKLMSPAERSGAYDLHNDLNCQALGTCVPVLVVEETTRVLAPPASDEATTRTPGPVRYMVAAIVVAPDSTQHVVDQVRDTVAEAQTLAQQVAQQGVWEPDQSGETVGTYWPAHRVLAVHVSQVVL